MQLEIQFPIKEQLCLFGEKVSEEERKRAIQEARDEIKDLYKRDSI